MASSADYRCRECGFQREFVFDHSPPATHKPDTDHFDELLEEQCGGTFDRRWTAPHMGRMSSGEPPR